MGVAAAEQTKYRINKKEWFKQCGYHPHLAQLRVHTCNSRFRTVVAGRRWGKSIAAAREAETVILTPNTRGWVVSKTYELGEKVFREIHNNLIINMGLPATHKSYSLKSGSMAIEFPWGSVVEVKSADHPDSLVGEGLDWLIFDECAKCKRIVWEQYLRPTLTDKNGWALFITTPEGYNWVYDIWQRGHDESFPDWASFRSPSWENPHLSKEDIEEARRTLSAVVFGQEYGAEFKVAIGLVYNEFDQDTHVKDFVFARAKPENLAGNQVWINPEWRKYRAFDFGYSNPFVCLYMTVDPEDNIYIYKEYYLSGKTTREHGLALVDGQEYQWNAADPSGADQRATLAQLGIYTRATRSGVQVGLELVRQALKLRANGKPGLYVSRKCSNTIAEFLSYVYPDGRTTEDPVKENDHSLDALRYFIVNYRQGGIRQSIGQYR